MLTLFRLTALSAAVALASTVSGCSSKSSTDPASGAGRAQGHHRLLKGARYDTIKKLQALETIESCDTELESIKLELAQAVDARSTEIDALATSTLVASSAYRREKFGPATFVVRNTKAVTKPGWQKYRYSWRILYADYLAIQEQPTDRAWAGVREDLDYLIDADSDRLVAEANMALDHESGPPREKLTQLVEGCLAKPECAKPEIDAALREFISRVPRYAGFLRLLDQGPAMERSRQLVHNWQTWLAADEGNHGFRPYPLIKMIDGVLHVPLNAGTFKGFESELASIMEPIWSSTDLRVKIDWQDGTPESGVFNVFYDPSDPLGRSGRHPQASDDDALSEYLRQRGRSRVRPCPGVQGRLPHALGRAEVRVRRGV